METDPRRWIEALRASHDALLSQVATLSPVQLDLASYCSGWDVGQVLSHLGSGAEIGLLNLERALGGHPPLDREDFPVIWGRWNGYNPTDKASQLVVWDRRHVSVLAGLDDVALSSLRVPFFGMELDAANVVGFRLSEHAVHGWDVAVSFDPEAELLGSSTELVVDRLGFMVARTAKPEQAGGHRHIRVRTSQPDRSFLLALEDKASLEEAGDEPGDGVLELPAAALVRLVYGRLDPDHTPAGVKTEGQVDLDELRRVFPGF